MSALLEVDDVTIHFGGIHALEHVSLGVERGAIHAVIGPNGAGKSTLLNVITNHYPPSRGEVRFEGRRVTGVASHRVARLGIARTFQNLELFGRLSVLDNVMVGCEGARKVNGLSAESQAARLLALVGLAGLESRKGSELAYGQQKLLEVARALSIGPRLLLLDEAASGLSSIDVSRLAEVLRDVVAAEHVTVLLVEHHMGLVMDISTAVTVLDHGRVIASGPPNQVREDPGVIAAYLGQDDATLPAR